MATDRRHSYLYQHTDGWKWSVHYRARLCDLRGLRRVALLTPLANRLLRPREFFYDQ